MLIELKKFGKTLTSRDDGREALAAFLPSLKNLPADELIEVSFDGVNTLSPSWADEFISGLRQLFWGRLNLLPSNNPSVKATLELLGDIYQANLKRKP
ncbi:MAG: DUF4325 domain-containing protein [Candidatus Komeilibacteria bacterium]|nr:DUF4325 domain-containing protein [Candidatus Komeilibacteria bacterium]